MRYSSTTTLSSMGQRTYCRHPATQTRYCQDKNAHSRSQMTPSRTDIDSKTTQRHYSFCIRLLRAESSSIVPAIPTYLDLGLNASSDFEAVMSHEGATEVLLFLTTSRTGQILLIPASRLTLLPHVLKCPNQLSDTLVGGTTTIKTMQRSMFSSTQVRPSIFRDMRQVLLADCPASCLCNQDLPSMDSTAPLPQKELASFSGKLSTMMVPFVLFAALVIMFPVPRCDYPVHKLSSANTKPADSLLTPTGYSRASRWRKHHSAPLFDQSSAYARKDYS